MRRRPARLTAVFVLACVAVDVPARAELLVSFFLDGALGAGLTSGIHSVPSIDYGGSRYSDRRSLAGPVVDVTVTPGIGGKNFGLGVAFDGMLMQSFWKDSNASSVAMASASAVLLWRVDESGFYGSVAFGRTAGGETTCDSVTQDAGALSNPCDDGMSGPRFAMGVGYMWPNGVGFRTTGSYSYLSQGDEYYRPLTMVVQGTLSSW